MVLLSKNTKKILSSNKKSVQNKVKQFNNFKVSFLLTVLAFLLIVPCIVARAEENQTVTVESGVSIAFDSHKPVVLVNVKPEILPGESSLQKEQREAAEAAEAAKKLASTKKVVSATKRVYTDPANFDEIYKRAESVFGVDWRLLRAVHYVETGCSGSTYKTSYAGATGPMQFLPSTFRHYAVDGNSDGILDISNVEDAIFSAAKYLKACGYPDVKRALWGYNRSTSYYYKVMEVANSLGFNG